MLGAAVVPFGPALIARGLGVVAIDFVLLRVTATGWSGNTPDAVASCYRVNAQLVTYVVPLGSAYVGAIMMARSLSTAVIVQAQSGLWFIILQTEPCADSRAAAAESRGVSRI